MRLPLLPGWVRWATVLGVGAVIAVYSIVPLPPEVRAFGPFGVLRLQQYAHLLAYASLAAVLGYALADSRWSDRRTLAVVFLVAVGYGLVLEAIQAPLPYRQFDVIDLVLNAVGTAVAVGVWRVLLARVRFCRMGGGSASIG